MLDTCKKMLHRWSMAEITLEEAQAKLSVKQLMFCAEYPIDLNATQAAIRAKYSKKTACQQAARLLTNVYVQKIIQINAKQRFERLDITQENILQELGIIAFADIKDYITIEKGGRVEMKPFDEMPEDATRAIESVKEALKLLDSGEGDGVGVILDRRLEFKQHSKIKALELLGKHMKLFTDKVELTGDSMIEALVEKVHELECERRGGKASGLEA